MLKKLSLLNNRHIQTLYAPFFRKFPKTKFIIERFNLKDKDFVEAYWYKQKPKKNQPIVVLFHGLAGSYKSPYIQGAMQELENRGFASVLMHFRGCSGKDNLLPRSYHSGDTEDARAYITHLHKSYPKSKLHAIGYSIGGNMLLKLLGKDGLNTPLLSAISVSAPLDLDICANTIDRGFAKIYQAYLLKPLKEQLKRKFLQFDMKQFIDLKANNIDKIKTIREFDNLYTAPINSFKNANNYYKRCSAKQYLKDIKIPTLIIHALDDPFMTPDILPKKSEIFNSITLKVVPYGGHVGFIKGSIFKPEYTLDSIVSDFFTSF